MRKQQRLITHREGFVRLLIYGMPDGAAYLFLYAHEEDGPCDDDERFPSVDEALDAAARRFGAAPDAWLDLPDPLPGCQHDWIAPLRVVGRTTGAPQWGCYERLEEGRWVPSRA